ncbi:MAG: hypothetical protein JWP25_429 [Bradyrhizobium sp.]|nr:hypothetical protein [Bradyrhizobium sp.]
MAKQVKFFRKEADKAERAAAQAPDPDTAAGLRAVALGYRAQADLIRKSKLENKQRKANRTK